MIALAVVFLIPLFAFLLIQSSPVQTWLVRSVSQSLSTSLKADIRVGKVDLSFFDRVELNHVFVGDSVGDTLLYSGEIKAKIDLFNLRKKKVKISEIWISEADLNIIKKKKAGYNFNPLINSLRELPVDTINPWEVKLNRVHFLKSNIYWHQEGATKSASSCFDPSNLIFQNFNLSAKRIEQRGDTVSFQLFGGQFDISEEFNIRGFEAIVEATPNRVDINRLYIKTDKSDININTSRIDLSAYQKSGLLEDLRFNLNFINSSIAFSDFGCFVPAFDGMNSVIGFSGDFKGSLSNFRAKRFSLSSGRNIRLYGDISVNGLPKIDETFLFLNFYESILDLEEVSQIKLPNSSKKEYIRFPDRIYSVGLLEFKGKFSGFINDFVAYGSLKSDFGELNTDVVFKVQDKAEEVKFRGQVSTDGFDLGKLLHSEVIGGFSFAGQVNGTIDKEGELQAYMNGGVDSLELNGYVLNDIALNGQLSENKFDGDLVVNDPNLDLNFKGKVDLSGNLPLFNFYADLEKVNIPALNLIKNTNVREVGCKVDADFTGLNFDDLTGNIHLKNFYMSRETDEVNVENLNLSIFSEEGIKYAQLRSDFIDGDVKGDFTTSNFGKSFRKFVAHYLPNTEIERNYSVSATNNFDFNLLVKKANPLAQFVSPYFNLRTPATLSGHFNSKENEFKIYGDIPEVIFNKFHATDIKLSGNSDSDRFKLRLNSSSLQVGENVPLHNFTVNNILQDNDASINVSWSNWEEKTFSGSLGTKIHFNEKINGKSSMDIDILPSRVYLADTLWKFDQARIDIDSTRFYFDNFRVHHNEEVFEVNGAISEDKNESMEINFERINLNSVDLITGKDIEVDGIVNGSTRMFDFYGKRLFYSDLSVDSVVYRKKEFGDVRLTSKWDQESQNIFSDLSLIKDNISTLKASGTFSPSLQTINYNAQINGLPLDFLHLFMRTFTDYVDGTGYGDLKVHGPIDHPSFNGKVLVDSTSIGISYLKTGYTFSDEVVFSGDSIIFDEITIHDRDGNTGLLDGEIVHTFFHNLYYNLGVSTDRLLALNTTSADNEIYYGRGYVSGAFRLSGFGKNVHADVSVKSEKGSRFFIPLETPESINETSFVRFVSKDTIVEKSVLQIAEEPNGFTLNLDVEATPDAKIQLIFDATTGDIMKGEGSGNIKMTYDKDREYKMYGDYMIESGEYLFTLQKVINKRFKVNRGGTIIWSGDPYNADIEIDAVYRVKASLYDLFLDSYGDTYNSETLKERRVPVECIIHLTDNLLNPTVDFDLDFPNAEKRLKDDVQRFISTEEDMNRQIMYLLVLGQFYTPDYMRGNSEYEESGSNLVGSTVSDVFSNQLSNWLSQISSDIDVGFNYRPGTELTGREIELALSTQLLDDRVTINGNIISNDASSSNASRIVGDVEIKVQIDKKGKIQLKAYTRSNDNLIYETSPYTQGVGVSYSEEFESWKALFKRYLQSLIPKKKSVKNDKKDNEP